MDGRPLEVKISLAAVYPLQQLKRTHTHREANTRTVSHLKAHFATSDSNITSFTADTCVSVCECDQIISLPVVPLASIDSFVCISVMKTETVSVRSLKLHVKD